MAVNYPSIQECYSYFERYRMLDNIRGHSLLVARVAAAIFDDLTHFSSPRLSLPQRELVISGALLHDIAKTPCLANKLRHDLEGARICEGLGYPALAEIVAEHVHLTSPDSRLWQRGVFAAKELVNYADKRVNHELIVSLDERLAYILERYGENDTRRMDLIRQNFQRTIDLEQKLSRFLSFAPNELTSIVAGLQPDAFTWPATS